MLTEIGSVENVPGFIQSVKDGKGRLQGFGHRVYKNFDRGPRSSRRPPTRSSRSAGKNPLLDIALKLEEVALQDDYFTLAQALPKRRLLLGPDLPGHGFPPRDVHRLVRHPPHRRVVGPLQGTHSIRT
jgi:citrate synthase